MSQQIFTTIRHDRQFTVLKWIDNHLLVIEQDKNYTSSVVSILFHKKGGSLAALIPGEVPPYFKLWSIEGLLFEGGYLFQKRRQFQDLRYTQFWSCSACLNVFEVKGVLISLSQTSALATTIVKLMRVRDFSSPSVYLLYLTCVSFVCVNSWVLSTCETM